MKAPQDGDFWNLDLTRLSLAGWLLILVSIGIIFGLMFIVFMMLPGDWDEPTRKRWAGIGLIPCIGAGAVLFALGRKWLDNIGWPIMRPAKELPRRR